MATLKTSNCQKLLSWLSFAFIATNTTKDSIAKKNELLKKVGTQINLCFQCFFSVEHFSSRKLEVMQIPNTGPWHLNIQT